jgi:hypothetical protein
VGEESREGGGREPGTGRDRRQLTHSWLVRISLAGA